MHSSASVSIPYSNCIVKTGCLIFDNLYSQVFHRKKENACICINLWLIIAASNILQLKLYCCALIAQLTEIRKVRYAKIVCENADNIPRIQPDVFFNPLSVVKLVSHSIYFLHCKVLR